MFGQSMFGQMPQGRYEGALTRDGSVQLISLDFSDTIITYDIPELGFYDVKCEKIFWNKDTLNINIYYGNFYCFFDKNTGDISGISQKWDPKIRLHLKKEKQKEKNFIDEEVQFRSSAVSLSGVIFKPKNSNEPIPYVILIHGSDYQDRNTPYYHSLGYVLASNGIGVLLYDKRGCGHSTGSLEQSSFSDLANDGVAALGLLKGRKDLNISKIGFLGTSQGGWVSTIAADKTNDCSFIIMNVGPSVSLFEQDIDRVQYSMVADGWETPIVDSAVAYTKLYFKYVQSDNAKDWKVLEKYCSAIRNKEWAEYLNIPTKESDEDILWWRKNAFDPTDYLKQIKCPVLSIFGEKDVLVPPSKNETKMDSLLKLSGTQYKIITIKGCAHDMLTYQGLNGANWNWPSVYWQWRKQPEEFMKTILEWVEKIEK
jgi:pimeloyl-ACP methyl ester carboxylesterase